MLQHLRGDQVNPLIPPFFQTRNNNNYDPRENDVHVIELMCGRQANSLISTVFKEVFLLI